MIISQKRQGRTIGLSRLIQSVLTIKRLLKGLINLRERTELANPRSLTGPIFRLSNNTDIQILFQQTIS